MVSSSLSPTPGYTASPCLKNIKSHNTLPQKENQTNKKENQDKKKKWKFSSSDYFPMVKAEEWNILVGWEGRLIHWSRGSRFYFLRETEEQKLDTVESPPEAIPSNFI